MRASIAMMGSVVLLAGCLQDAELAADTFARDTAKTFVNGVVQAKLPGVNAAPLTDCIIDNASRDEIIQIATSAATGADQAATEMVLGIAQRPDTLTCAAEKSLGLAGVLL